MRDQEGLGDEATIEGVIEKILSTCPEVSREQIMERFKDAKMKTGGLISDETLLRMIAAEFGVKFSRGETLTPTLPIRDLVPSLSDVTVVGRVVAVFGSKTFKRNKNGKLASLLIADRNDMLRVVLWNERAGLVESGELRVGQVVRLSHGYTREDRGGRVELHFGDKGEIEINPRDVEAKEYPTIRKFITKIGEITQAFKNKRVNVVGMVKEPFLASTFKRQDSSSGKVMRFMLADATGEVSVVVWNEKADELENVPKKGVDLEIVNAKVKKSVGGGLEIHVDSGTYVEVLPPAEESFKIADLKEGLNHVSVEGEVVAKPMFRDVKTAKGEIVKVTVFELKDETGGIWVSAWRKHADTVSNLKLGDKIAVKNAYVKRGFGDRPEISTKSSTAIIILPESTH